MDQSSVAEGHHLVQSRDLILSNLVVEQLLPYLRIGLRYHVQVKDHVYPFVFDGKV